MINQPQLTKVSCTNCFFESFKLEAGSGVFVLTCTNCATKYVLGTALGQIIPPKVPNNVK